MKINSGRAGAALTYREAQMAIAVARISPVARLTSPLFLAPSGYKFGLFEGLLYDPPPATVSLPHHDHPLPAPCINEAAKRPNPRFPIAPYSVRKTYLF
jgi:hypothetical protein